MKILLINPPVFNDLGKPLTNTPPLGLLYLAAFAEKNGYSDVKVIDADSAMITWQALESLFIKERPDVVGITGPSRVLPALIKTAEIARQSLPNCRIIAGGFGSTKEPAKVLKAANRAVNFIVLGEGELTFLELLEQFKNPSGDFHQINGLAFLDQKGNLTITKPRDYIRNLSFLPWPAYHLLEPDFAQYPGMHGLNNAYKELKGPSGILLTSRGCPHRCTFCSLGSIMYRERDTKDVIDEMEFLKNKFGLRTFQIYDDEFIGLSPKQNERVEAICNEIIKRGLHKSLGFWVQGRCSQFIQLETLKKMKEAGIAWIAWGVESGSQKVLDSVKKDIRVENVIRDFSLAKKAGIKSLAFMMIGFPGETPADIKLTAELVEKIKPDITRFHIVTPYPGSELREYLEKHGLLETNDDYKFDTRVNIIHHTEEMSAEEIKKYYKLLTMKYEHSRWYYVRFLTKSLAGIDGWKKLLKRIQLAKNYFLEWRKIDKNSLPDF